MTPALACTKAGAAGEFLQIRGTMRTNAGQHCFPHLELDRHPHGGHGPPPKGRNSSRGSEI